MRKKMEMEITNTEFWSLTKKEFCDKYPEIEEHYDELKRRIIKPKKSGASFWEYLTTFIVIQLFIVISSVVSTADMHPPGFWYFVMAEIYCLFYLTFKVGE